MSYQLQKKTLGLFLTADFAFAFIDCFGLSILLKKAELIYIFRSELQYKMERNKMRENNKSNMCN